MAFVGRAPLPRVSFNKSHGDPPRQTSLLMIVFVPPSPSKPPCVGSPARLRGRTASSCWIKSSVSTLAACQQRSARAACLWKHNRLSSALSYSNKEEHYRERRVCLTSVWSFFRDKYLWKRPTAHFQVRLANHFHGCVRRFPPAPPICELWEESL